MTLAHAVDYISEIDSQVRGIFSELDTYVEGVGSTYEREQRTHSSLRLALRVLSISSVALSLCGLGLASSSLGGAVAKIIGFVVSGSSAIVSSALLWVAAEISSANFPRRATNFIAVREEIAAVRNIHYTEWREIYHSLKVGVADQRILSFVKRLVAAKSLVCARAHAAGLPRADS